MSKRAILACIVFTWLILLPKAAFEDVDLRVYKGNLFRGTFFEDPIEKLVIVFPDGEFFYFTTSQEGRITMDGWMCVAILKQNERDIANAVIVIHNHPMGFPRFSKGDMNFLRILESYGFEGSFLLYYQPQSKIVSYHGKEVIIGAVLYE